MIRPGDVGATRGSGAVGGLIRFGTAEGPIRDTLAHTFLWVELLHDHEDGSQCWITHEAFGSRDPLTGHNGVRARVRDTRTEHVETLDLGLTDEERTAVLAASDRIVATTTGYDWFEIARLACYCITRRLHVPLTRLGEFLFRFSKEDKRICSNHCAFSLLAARPALSLSFPPERIWPDRLVRDLRPLTH